MSDEDPDAETEPEDGSAEDGDGGRTESPEESTEERTGPDTAADVQEVLDRITEHDDDLARDVGSIVETARTVNERAEAQREELSDLEDRVARQAETIEELREELDSRERTLEEREETIDDLESRIKRTQADFQNYKRRAKKRQEEIKRRATEDLVERLVGVRDDLKRALEEGGDDVESLREGLELTAREFDRVLAEEGVEEIDPDPGSDVDPTRHEVMARIDSDRPEGTIADVYAPGYEMDGSVVRAAQVTVSNGELAGDESGGDRTEREDDGADDPEADGETGSGAADSETDDGEADGSGAESPSDEEAEPAADATDVPADDGGEA